MADNLKDWQQGLDRLAYFHLLAVPDAARPNEPSYRNGELTAVQFHATAHRFDVGAGQFAGNQGYGVANTVGTEAAPFDFHWAPIPEEFTLLPDRAVAATPFDPVQSQIFEVTAVDLAIGQGGQNRIAGFGTGRSYPIQRAGPPLTHIAACGVITGGKGALAGRMGMFALGGLFTPPDDFQLNVLVMIKDPGALYATTELPAIEPVKGLPRSSTFLSFSTYVPTFLSTTIVPWTGPAGPPVAGIASAEKLRLCATSFSARGPEGLASRYQIGPTAGEHPINVKFCPTSLRGASLDDPATAYNLEQFQLYDGSRHIGTLGVENYEIRTILTPIDGLPAELVTQMFAAFGPINNGTGAFAGAQGFQINCGVGTLVPHLTSILYLAELADPTGRFRA
jgi:hypothetical protein